VHIDNNHKEESKDSFESIKIRDLNISNSERPAEGMKYSMADYQLKISSAGKTKFDNN
jgi:hypothetical protein